MGKILNVNQTASRMHLSPRHVLRHIHERRLPAYKHKGRWWIDEDYIAPAQWNNLPCNDAVWDAARERIRQKVDPQDLMAALRASLKEWEVVK